MTFYIIDDAYGDQRPGAQGNMPTYLPLSGNWDPAWGTCPQCSGTGGPRDFQDTPVDVSKVQSGTWHTTTMNPGEPLTTFSVSFTGTQISVFCLLPPYLGVYDTTSMNMSFTLDGQVVSHFTRPTSLAADWTYNYSVYDSNQLSNTSHTLVVTPLPGANSSFVVFDYFRYQFDSDLASPPPPPPPNTSPTSSSSPASPPTPTLPGSSSSTSSSLGPSAPSSSASLSISSHAIWPPNPSNGPQPVSPDSSPPGSQPSRLSGSAVPSISGEDSSNPISTNPATSVGDSHAKPPVAAIAGAVCGVAFVLFLIILAFCLRRRSRRARAMSVDERDSPSSRRRRIWSLIPYTATSPPFTAAISATAVSASQSSSQKVSSAKEVRTTASSERARGAGREHVGVEVESPGPAATVAITATPTAPASYNASVQASQSEKEPRGRDVDEGVGRAGSARVEEVELARSPAATQRNAERPVDAANLQREIELVRSMVQELMQSAAVQDIDEPPPSYFSE